MNMSLGKIITDFGAAVLGICLMFSAAMAEPVPYLLDAERSRVGFTWVLGNEAIEGVAPVARAEIVLDFDDVSKSRVDVVVDAARADAGAFFADEALKGPSVLWVSRFPELSFVSREVRRDGEGGAIVTGDMTVRGVSREQVFRVQAFRPGGTVAGDRAVLTLRIEGALSRAAFGADGFAALVDDRIELRIQAEVTARP